MDNLKEIRRGETGTGLLIENDGYISPEIGDNKHLFESYKVMLNEGDLESLPDPFVVDAVFQKYGIENANGRIYPEDILKKAVDKYQDLIKNRMAIGECYTPDALCLTQNGWKPIAEIEENENILTVNVQSNKIEIQPVSKKVEVEWSNKLIGIKGALINDVVTPNHGFPIYNEHNEFYTFLSAEDLANKKYNLPSEYFIPSFNNDNLFSEKIFINTLECSQIDYDGKVYCVEVPNHTWFVQQNGFSHLTKNCNHPDESVIDLSRVAINIIELHWEKNTLVGKMEIPVTNGFRKYGIISCQADQVAHLILSGIKIGVSSRGLGSVTSKMGTLYVSDDYEIVCWDVVSTPSTPGAYIARDKKDLTQYIESRENQSKGTLIDSLDSFNDWLSKI